MGHFATYTHTLLFYLPEQISAVFAFAATAAEVVFGILLILGLATRWVAIGSGLLLLSFAVSMTVALGVHAPLNNSVVAASAASFLLAEVPVYRWSLDARRQQN